MIDLLLQIIMLNICLTYHLASSWWLPSVILEDCGFFWCDIIRCIYPFQFVLNHAFSDFCLMLALCHNTSVFNWVKIVIGLQWLKRFIGEKSYFHWHLNNKVVLPMKFNSSVPYKIVNVQDLSNSFYFTILFLTTTYGAWNYTHLIKLHLTDSF